MAEDKKLEARVKELETKNKELEAENKKLKTDNRKLGEDFLKLQTEKAELEKQLAKEPNKNAPGPPDEEEQLSKADLVLIEQGCKAYGIDPKFLFNARIDRETGEAVILTNGGEKVRYLKGMEKEEGFQQIEQIRIDGIVRKKPRVVAGKKKK